MVLLGRSGHCKQRSFLSSSRHPLQAAPMLFGFQDLDAERAFRLHFARGSATRHVVAATVGLLLLLAQLLMAAVSSNAAPVTHVLLRMAWIADFFLVFCLLGRKQYTLCLGPYTLWKRLIGTCYFWNLAKCTAPKCVCTSTCWCCTVLLH